MWIRIVGLMLEYSIEFALNAVFFTSDLINAEAEKKSSEGAEAIGFWFIITNEFWKCF
eukprot:CAMPEP_0170534996 /NCGR_PEP_ID=MMETSP0209-20121228/96859_1 /TAXON_ID=665100 ORGANISM="Litonotus pictus, Strain P1" /NCGR_SAMPLE_ID=MMETSP0209 /ASSEMBLY_ACC=CAM_ASM_000301 /LENGTH=57 /DNA_ID=CAMNT_0010835341 /DNA_START=18 /DNA_END=188 /DNA_ORIENTATION=+